MEWFVCTLTVNVQVQVASIADCSFIPCSISEAVYSCLLEHVAIHKTIQMM